MSGKELFDALGRVDERFLEEAELGMFPGKTAAFWTLVPMAACLCLLLGLWLAVPEILEDVPVTVPDAAQSIPAQTEDAAARETEATGMPDTIEMNKESAVPPLEDMPSVVLRVEKITENGFIGTVAELPASELFALGMELTVVLGEDTRDSLLSEADAEMKCFDTDCTGALILVRFTEYDRETGTLLATRLEEAGKSNGAMSIDE